MGRYAVYVLKDPSGEVRYVGITKNPDKRLKSHLREWRGKNTHRANWMRELVESGETPSMEVLEWVSDWDEAERRWVAKFKADGCRLVNGNDGGTTMHQVRRRSECYPAIKRTYRVLERKMHGKYINAETVERYRQLIAFYSQLVARHRKNGTLAVLNSRLAASRLLGADH